MSDGLDSLALRCIAAEDRCESSSTFRDEECMTYHCELPKGHKGEHRDGDAEWTDETTWFE